MKILFLMMSLSSLMFMLTNHPMSMGLMLLCQAILVAMVTGSMSLNFWFSYILFMIMIGGLLVLFTYMTSVAANEKFFFSSKSMLIMLMTLIMLTLMLTMMEPLSMSQTFTNSDTLNSNMTPLFQISLYKYINMPSSWVMISMIIYLLITLIAVVKITDISYGPLRQKF